MHLSKVQEDVADKMRSYIINNNTKDKLKEHECKVCNGTGLEGVHKIDRGGHSWSGEYCNSCKGIGFLNPEQISKEHYFCHRCNGTGKWDRYNCSLCRGTGMVDWLTHVLG